MIMLQMHIYSPVGHLTVYLPYTTLVPPSLILAASVSEGGAIVGKKNLCKNQNAEKYPFNIKTDKKKKRTENGLCHTFKGARCNEFIVSDHYSYQGPNS